MVFGARNQDDISFAEFRGADFFKLPFLPKRRRFGLDACFPQGLGPLGFARLRHRFGKIGRSNTVIPQARAPIAR